MVVNRARPFTAAPRRTLDTPLAGPQRKARRRAVKDARLLRAAIDGALLDAHLSAIDQQRVRVAGANLWSTTNPRRSTTKSTTWA